MLVAMVETLRDFKGRSSCSSLVYPASGEKTKKQTCSSGYVLQIWCAGTFMKWVTRGVPIKQGSN